MSVAVKTRAFGLPKHGHTEDEYEDAYRLPDGGPPWRVAVADGATESAFARSWARVLVDGFAADGTADFAEAVAGWRDEWRAAVAGRVAGLPWYAAAKAEEGAFATLTGLALGTAGCWEALAVGDACLFHLRAGALLRAWPLDAPEAFDHRPALLGSLASYPVPPPERCSGTYAPGDVFVLATDALAAWLLQTDVAAVAAWTPGQFAAEVAQARRARTLRNDDVTLVVVEIE